MVVVVKGGGRLRGEALHCYYASALLPLGPIIPDPSFLSSSLPVVCYLPPAKLTPSAKSLLRRRPLLDLWDDGCLQAVMRCCARVGFRGQRP